MKLISITLVQLVFAIYGHSQFDVLVIDQVIIQGDCEGQILESKFKIYGPSGDSIKLFNLSSNLCDIEFKHNERSILNNDTIVLYDQQEYEIEFTFKYSSQQENYLHYSTDFIENKVINVNTGSYYITHKEVESDSKKIINLKNNCSDSIRVYFPYGGTVTSVSVHENNKNMDFSKAIGYGAGEPDNYITFGRNELGKYFVRYASCWWGEDFWLELINE